MEEKLKRRLVGAGVLISLAIIFVPMLLDRPAEMDQELVRAEISPAPSERFDGRLLAEPVPAPEPVQPFRPSVIDQAELNPMADAPPVPAAAPRQGLSGWAVQVASFSHRDKAKALVQRLRAKSFDTFSEAVDIRGVRHYRVFVGPFPERAQASRRLEQIEKAVALRGRIRRYP